MGLSCTVFEGPLEAVGSMGREEACERDLYVPTNHNGFDRGAPLEYGIAYRYAKYHESFSTRAYSSYGFYREELAKLVSLPEGRTDQGQRRYYLAAKEDPATPFFEQLVFGDNEDTLGPEACRELAGDYEEWEAEARKVLDERTLETYLAWKDATRLAADTDGCIDFH